MYRLGALGQRLAIAIVALVALAVLSYPSLVAAVALNLAQIERLHGGQPVALLQVALGLAPQHEQLRWQTGAVFAETGDFAAAATTLAPLAETGHLSGDAARLLFASLIESHQAAQLAELYTRLPTPPWLPQRTAAAVTHSFLLRQGLLTPTQSITLLAPSLGLERDQPEFQLITSAVTTRAFWERPEGKRLATFLAAMAAPTSSGQGRPADLSALAAHLLGQPVAAVHLGPELIANGGFEAQSLCFALLAYCTPAGWSPSLMSNGDPWNHASFAVTADHSVSYSGTTALRVDGILLERNPNRESARAGADQTPITLTANIPYLISFVYRTEGVREPSVGLWLSADPLTLFAGEQLLPPTDGMWKRVIIIAWNRKGAASEVRPLLRLWAEGTVWFDEVTLRSIYAESQLSPKFLRIISDP